MEQGKLLLPVFALVAIACDGAFGSFVDTVVGRGDFGDISAMDPFIERGAELAAARDTKAKPPAPKTTPGFVTVAFDADFSKLKPQDRTVAKIQAGVVAGEGITKVLAAQTSSDLIGDIAGIANKIAPFLGAIGPIFGLLDFFIPKGPSPELQYMKKQFSLINTKFDQVFSDIDEVKALVVKEAVKTQYGQYQGVVSTLSSLLSDAIQAKANGLDNETIESRINMFKSEYNKNDVLEAINMLNDGMMGGSTLLIDIPKSVRDYTADDRLKTQNMLKGVLSIIIKGVKVFLSYKQMMGDNDSFVHHQKIWTNKISSIVSNIQSLDTEIKNRWKDQGEIDINKILADKASLSNSDIADYLYTFFADKYDWRAWFVVAYDDVTGSDKHFYLLCSGFLRKRVHGRNLVMSSNPKNQPTYADMSSVRRELNAVNSGRWVSHPFFWGHVNSYDYYDAKDLYGFIPDDLKSQCSSVGAIEKSSSPTYKSAANRMVRVTVGSYYLHAFR